MLAGDPDAHERLVFSDLGGDADDLSKGVAHTSTHTVSSCSGSKRVLTQYVVRVDHDLHLEALFGEVLLKKSVGSKAGRFDRVVADLKVGSSSKLDHMGVVLLVISHVKSHHTAVWPGPDEGLLSELTISSIWALQGAICHELPFLCHYRGRIRHPLKTLSFQNAEIRPKPL